MEEHELSDFAIGEFPVTLGEYLAFLDDLSEEEREQRIPREKKATQADVVRVDGEWALSDYAVEGQQARQRVADRWRDLPVNAISYLDAVAYCAWLSEKTGQTYRLPTSIEWDKAARGVDGRAFPMATRIEPSFAKLRESRPETSQPEPVGAFPLDESPYGVRDSVGGVQEWTSTKLTADQMIARGGSWTIINIDRRIGHAMYRTLDRTGWVGVRVALDVATPTSRVTVTSLRR
jgi:serine/threonine-protein kinase